MITIILAKVTMALCVIIIGLMTTLKIMSSVDMKPRWLTLSLGVMILVSPLMATATVVSYIVEFL